MQTIDILTTIAARPVSPWSDSFDQSLARLVKRASKGGKSRFAAMNLSVEQAAEIRDERDCEEGWFMHGGRQIAFNLETLRAWVL